MTATTHDNRIDELVDTINKAIDDHRDKEKLTYAAAIGALEMVKSDLIDEARGRE